jgi:hypothetical protein
MEFFDASAPPPAKDRTADVLKRLQADDADRRLFALFDEIDERIDEGRDRDREQGVDPAILARLAAIAGADDAPYDFRALHRRVREGTLTWEALWLAPEAEPGAPSLIHEAMKAEGAELAGLLRVLEEEEGDQGPPPVSGSR